MAAEESRQSPIVEYGDKFGGSIGSAEKYDTDFQGRLVERRVPGIQCRDRGTSGLWRRQFPLAWMIGCGGRKGGSEMGELEEVYPKGSPD